MLVRGFVRLRCSVVTTPRLHLIFDADDTLWEANILFERAINDFIEWIAHPSSDKTAIRATLNDIEAANAVVHGYGTRVFLVSLHECFDRMLERPPSADDAARIEQLAQPLLTHAIEPIDGVESTLVDLQRRHDLLLLTKGDRREQQQKIDLSGFAPYFRRIVIVPEKNADVYVDLVETEAIDRAHTWMIGNSPKSDIAPALAAGLGAVFIPNAHTWALEHDEFDETAERLVQIERFVDLLSHF
jgi:putative hydrolase of the HAD superfamily